MSVQPSGWARFEDVKMPDYRWGVFLVPDTDERRIGFGDNAGRPALEEVRRRPAASKARRAGTLPQA